MDNTYDFLSRRPQEFRQLAVKDMLFLHYTCPQIDKYLYIFNHFNQISFTLCGDKIFHRGTKSWIMTENTTIFAKKGAWKQEIGSTGWEILSFYIPDNFLHRFFKENRQLWPLKSLPVPSGDMFIEIKVNQITRAFFYSILPYFTQQPAPPEDLLELKFKELLFTILSNPENAGLLAYINNMCDNAKPPVYEVMENNYYFNLSIPEFARLTQRSVTTFKRDFHRYYRTTPGKWLTRKRLEYAKLLLDTSEKNISEISFDSGFENMTHFSKIFKQQYSISPNQYRKANQAHVTA
ncbi:MAG: helix-turn-helix transcriptional regulator [Chitinophagaceae bacterium]|nr:helix-turn-helix transcriptional regulator [Chitinophagaceae bacterium]